MGATLQPQRKDGATGHSGRIIRRFKRVLPTQRRTGSALRRNQDSGNLDVEKDILNTAETEVT